MALPEVYTANNLAQSMLKWSTTVGVDLGWTVPAEPEADPDDAGSLEEPINDLLSEMYFDSLELVPAERHHELRLRARVHLWTFATESYVTAYSVGGLARTLARGQLFDHANLMLARAEQKLAAFLLAEQLAEGGPPIGTPTSGTLYVIPVWGDPEFDGYGGEPA